MFLNTPFGHVLTLFRPGGRGTFCPPVTYLGITVQVHVRACWKNLNFPNYEFVKRSMLFTPWNYLVSPKKYSLTEIPEFHKGDPGTLTNWAKRLSINKTFQKSIIDLKGSGHPNFVNPFEYGQSFTGKLFPKRIGTLTQPNPKYLGF